MRTNLILRATVSVAALAIAQTAHAVDWYAGIGAEFGNVDAGWDVVPLADASTQILSVLGGVRYAFPSNYFIGAELETSLATSQEFSGGGSVDIDRLSRIRALVGYKTGQYTFFGALGYTSAEGDLSGFSFDDTFDGMNFGIGAEMAVSERMDIRLEVIRDTLDAKVASDYVWDNTSIRAAAIIKF